MSIESYKKISLLLDLMEIELNLLAKDVGHCSLSEWKK